MALQEELEAQGNLLFRYRGVLPLIIIVVGFFVFVFDRFNGYTYDNFLPFPTVEFIALIVCLFGLVIRIYTVGHTPKNTSGRNTEGQLADKLNTSGIYSTVRHPLYVGNFFMWLGIALLTMNIWFLVSFILFYWVYYERIMYAEEQYLRKKFSNTYTDWAASTPAFIFSFKNWEKPNLPFSWKKVLKKEKNGLLAIFVMLFLFHTINQYIETKDCKPELNWITVGTAASTILYVILKFIKKKTSILDEQGR